MASVTSRGKDKYLIRVVIGYNESGNPIRTSRTVTAKNKTELKKQVALFIADLEKEGMREVSRNANSYTFKRFVNEIWWPEYATNAENLAVRTAGLYQSFIEDRFMPEFEKKQLNKITTFDIEKAIKKFERKDGVDDELSRSTKRNALYAIRSVLNLATKWHFISADPTIGITIDKDTRKEKKTYKPYSTAELVQLFESLESEPLDIQVMVTIAIITGARVGEVAALEEKHINYQEKTITLEQTIVQPKKGPPFLQNHTKTDEIKVVSVTDDLLTLIEKHIKNMKEARKIQSINYPNKFLFCHPDGKHFRPDTLSKRFSKFRKRHGIRDVRFHDLRHTSATFLLSQGVSMKVIQERLGHKDISTTMNIYAHVLKEVDQASADTFNKLKFNKDSATVLPQSEKTTKKDLDKNSHKDRNTKVYT